MFQRSNSFRGLLNLCIIFIQRRMDKTDIHLVRTYYKHDTLSLFPYHLYEIKLKVHVIC